MVSSFKVKKILLIVLGVICIGLLIAWVVSAFSYNYAHPPLPCGNLPNVEGDEIPMRHFTGAEGPHPAKVVGKDEENVLKTFFVKLSEDYTNGLYNVVARQIDDLPEGIFSVGDETFWQIISPLRVTFTDSFLLRGRGFSDTTSAGLLEFNNVEGFSQFMRANFKIGFFLGHYCFKKGDNSSFPGMLESAILLQLGRYRKKFVEEEKVSLVQTVDIFTHEWLEHIESNDGFTRRYMWQVVERYASIRERRKEVMRKYEIDVWLSRDEIFRIARDAARGLISQGYTPKWLDEFK